MKESPTTTTEDPFFDFGFEDTSVNEVEEDPWADIDFGDDPFEDDTFGLPPCESILEGIAKTNQNHTNRHKTYGVIPAIVYFDGN